ncbi:MAG: lipid II flippase MurJ [Candidatus Paceibacterota bacterium]
MVKRIISLFSKEISNIHQAAYLIAAFALLSQFLGLIRDRLLAGKFGAGLELDIYYAAFRIPDFIFTLIISLVSASVLIPFIIRALEKDSEYLKKFSDSIFTALALISFIFGVVSFIFTPHLLSLVFPEYMSGEFAANLILLTRILLFQTVLLAFSGFYMSYVQVFQKFFIYALSPILYNFGIIVGIVFFYEKMGIAGLAWGVVLGALSHLVITIPVVLKQKIFPKFIYNPDWKIIREVLMLSLPRTIALAGNQVSILVMLAFAAIMTTGSVAIFTFAFNLQSVPLSIIGASYSMAAFPTLAKLFAKGETKIFIEYVVKAARHIIFWSIPITVLFIVLRAQIVRTILGTGEFSWNDTRLVSAALALFVISAVAQSLILLFVRGYYSTGETLKPLYFSIISIVVTISSVFLLYLLYLKSPHFVALLESAMRVSSGKSSMVLILPIAFSIGQILNLVLLWASFDKKFCCFSDILWQSIFHTTASSIIMGYTTYQMLKVFDDVFDINTTIGIFSQGFYSGIIGIFVGVMVLILMGNQEIKTVGKTLHSRFWKSKVVMVEEEL